MDADLAWIVALLGVATLVSLALAALVLRAGPGRAVNRSLGVLLALEGLVQLTLALDLTFLPRAVRSANVLVYTGVELPLGVLRVFSIACLVAAYVVFLANVDAPITRPLRRASVRVTAAAAVIALGAWFSYQDVHATITGVPYDDSTIYPIYAGVGLFALVAALWSLARAPKGSPLRRRAGSFAIAFGVRDASTIAGVVVYAVLDGAGRDPMPWYGPIVSLGTIAFVALLAYALLRTQLFDVDLKIKVGIKRGTIAAVFVIAAFVAFQIAQQYLSRTYGIVAGGIVTGVLLFASPRLNKLADRAVDTALPNVQPTSEYLAFKKLEVYRAAVEGAALDGVIDAKERIILERLRAKLAITPSDALALEAELLPNVEAGAGA